MADILANVKTLCKRKSERDGKPFRLADLARELGDKDPAALHRMLKGSFTGKGLDKIASILGCQVGELFIIPERQQLVAPSVPYGDLRSIIVYQGKTYIANSMNELLDQVREMSGLGE